MYFVFVWSARSLPTTCFTLTGSKRVPLLPRDASALLTSGEQPCGVPHVVCGNPFCWWKDPEQTPLLAERYCCLFLVELLYIGLLRV